MKEITISKTIAELRKSKGITQEQLAKVLNVSSQAVSKWENGISLPDVLMLPQIAEYFNVSVDYILHGEYFTYSDIYMKVMDKVSAYGQQTKESYEEVLRLFASAFHGICRGGLKRDEYIWMYENPTHISDKNGVALLSGKGFGAVVTRDFFETITKADIEKYRNFFSHLALENNLLVISTIISMSDISFTELKEKTGLCDEALKKSLEHLEKFCIVEKNEVKHKALGNTYVIGKMYHSCICLLLSVMSVLVMGREMGICCCMGYGDFPIRFE